MAWTHQKITSLAPNSLVLEKATGLASPRRWAGIAGNGNLLWGECKSGGERHYHTVIRFGDESFRCDCKSSFHPCRHILALLFYFSRNIDKIAFAEFPPAWAQQLLKESPVERLTAEEKSRREAGRTRRFGQRLELMEQGNRELEEWLLDLARHGLSAIDEQPPAFWDGFASRMVDAKMRGAGRRIRNFKRLAGKENGFELLLEEMAELYLLAQAFKQLESLPEALQEDALSQMGVNRKKEEVLNEPGLTDTWLALGQAEGEDDEDGLRYRRTWFLGEKSSRLALLLDFSWGNKAYDTHWVVGGSVEGELVFYPGSYPLRALFRNHQMSNRPFQGKSGYATVEAFAQAYARALAANPWLQIFPCLLAEVFPAQEDGQLWLVDSAGKKISLSSESPARWNLLAVSGGRPVQAFGEWDGKALSPLAVVAEGRVVPL
ncbi:MAG: hypothetical protein H6557_16825 [Lewinellaceae bacterium]|nr:hypothetical protein [Phaeodactylibacter sp.]MCB9038280.1 hypothetical protein [Lewinellaceae bacterium]